ncbi:TOM1-like protein 9 isoform X2 [Macadamia integrifolia]|uniref:TOM1-like protein 9 isoform X2 n=1 Tax=Macadamia integrifolia TaxID=60698 RepID=UPI001C4E5D32|nr:TOM1-like protein 9 isoform X2 [Macadamia integrifolia]
MASFSVLILKIAVLLIFSSSRDESLLCQGLALNDDLQRLLAKHEAIASGTAVPVRPEKPKGPQSLVDVDEPGVTDKLKSTKSVGRSTSSAAEASQPLELLPAPPASNSPATALIRIDPKMDLLSGEDYNSPTADNALALVPVGEPQPTSPVFQQNILALSDMFHQNNGGTNSFNSQTLMQGGLMYPTSPQFSQQRPIQSPQSPFYMNGSTPNMGLTQYEHSPYGNPAWHQQQQPSYGAQSSGALPPPPWEAQLTEGSPLGGTKYPQPLNFTQVVVNSPQSTGNDNVVGMYIQPITNGQLAAINTQPVQSNQMVGMHPQPGQGGQMMGMLPQPITGGQLSPVHSNQMVGMHLQQIHGGQMMGMLPQPMQAGQLMSINQMPMQSNMGYDYGYPMEAQAQYLEQRMYGLSVQDDSALRNSPYMAPTSYLPPSKPSKPEDKLFGDLVSMAKVKPKNTTPGRAGSMEK